MSGATCAETIYRCSGCGNILLIADQPYGRIRAVYCRTCKTRQTVYLGGQQATPPRDAAPTPAPRMPAAATSAPRQAVTPPIETRRIRGGRG